jgi:hypothetical protein
MLLGTGSGSFFLGGDRSMRDSTAGCSSFFGELRSIRSKLVVFGGDTLGYRILSTVGLCGDRLIVKLLTGDPILYA